MQAREPPTDDQDAMRDAMRMPSANLRYRSRKPLLIAAWAAARRATGTRNGEQDT